MVCVALAAQGMLGHHMEGSWQLCVAALEEPGNKGEKYTLKNQNEQNQDSLLFALGCLACNHFFGKFASASLYQKVFDKV